LRRLRTTKSRKAVRLRKVDRLIGLFNEGAISLFDWSRGGIPVQPVILSLFRTDGFYTVLLDGFRLRDGGPAINKSEQALRLKPVEVVEKACAVGKYFQAAPTG